MSQKPGYWENWNWEKSFIVGYEGRIKKLRRWVGIGGEGGDVVTTREKKDKRVTS